MLLTCNIPNSQSTINSYSFSLLSFHLSVQTQYIQSVHNTKPSCHFIVGKNLKRHRQQQTTEKGKEKQTIMLTSAYVQGKKMATILFNLSKKTCLTAYYKCGGKRCRHQTKFNVFSLKMSIVCVQGFNNLKNILLTLRSFSPTERFYEC